MTLKGSKKQHAEACTNVLEKTKEAVLLFSETEKASMPSALPEGGYRAREECAKSNFRAFAAALKPSAALGVWMAYAN